MALHPAQGPDLGIPQMIQTRAQFGSYRSLRIVFVVILIGVGYAGVDPGCRRRVGQSGSRMRYPSPRRSSSSELRAVVLWFGYDLFHRYNSVIVWLIGGR